MLRKDFLEAYPVPDVGLMKDRAPAGYFLNAAKHLLRAVREVISDNDIEAFGEESDSGMAPDEAGAACYKYGAHLIISPALSSAA